VTRLGRLFQLAFIFGAAHMLYLGYCLSARSRTWSPEEYLIGYGAFMAVALCIAGWPLYLVSVLHGPLEELRRKYSGHLTRAGLTFPFPVMTYEVGKIVARFEARVEAFRHQQAMLVCRYELSHSVPVGPGPIWLKVFPETVLYSLAKLFGMQDLRIGHPDFDQKLIVQAQPIESFNPLLSEGLRENLVRLYRMSPNLHLFDIRYHEGTLIVQRSLELSRYGPWAADVVRQLDQVAWNLLDTLSPDRISAFAGAVEIVASGAAAEPSQCLVCAQVIADPVGMACTACDTPHHRDCWDYNGRCALFGCGGTRAREVALAVKPAAPPAEKEAAPAEPPPPATVN
jgi:hypothetical protein